MLFVGEILLLHIKDYSGIMSKQFTSMKAEWVIIKTPLNINQHSQTAPLLY